MNFRTTFQHPRYDDAPHLSDQLLLPNLAQGHNVYLFTSFAPSYLFRLVADLAASPEVEPGFLNVVFFVPGDLTVRSSGIARFRAYLTKFSESEQEVADFVNNVLALNEEAQQNTHGGIRITILHTSQRRPLARGCIGVISSSENAEDYVAFADDKGGDYNSPVRPLKSWVNEDFFSAEDILQKIIEASSGAHPRGIYVSDTEVIDWITHLSNYYLENPPKSATDNAAVLGDQDGTESPLDGVPENGITDDDFEDEFLDYLRDLEDFADEDLYGWVDASDDFDFLPVGDFGVKVEESEVVDGHIPPLPPSISELVGPARAHCPCGAEIVRAYGCHQVSWDH